MTGGDDWLGLLNSIMRDVSEFAGEWRLSSGRRAHVAVRRGTAGSGDCTGCPATSKGKEVLVSLEVQP